MKAIVVEFMGQKMTVKQAAEMTGLTERAMLYRHKRGIPLDAAPEEAQLLGRIKFAENRKKAYSRPGGLTAYLAEGDAEERAAKAICVNFKFTNPADFDFRKVADGRYAFDTEHLAFDIVFDHLTATCSGRFRKNDALLISRRFATTNEGKIREVTYG